MKKQVATISVVLLLAIALSLSVVSSHSSSDDEGIFSNLWGKVTGQHSVNLENNKEHYHFVHEGSWYNLLNNGKNSRFVIFPSKTPDKEISDITPGNFYHFNLTSGNETLEGWHKVTGVSTPSIQNPHINVTLNGVDSPSSTGTSNVFIYEKERNWYKDADRDGYYSTKKRQVNRPGNTQRQKKRWTDNLTYWNVEGGGDCVDNPLYGKNMPQWKFDLIDKNNDGDIADNIHPGQNETCNFIDDNCVNGTDEGYNKTTIYKDFDDDGYVDQDVKTTMCGSSKKFTLANYSGKGKSYSKSPEFKLLTDSGSKAIQKASGNLPPSTMVSGSNSNRINFSFIKNDSSKGPDCNDSIDYLTEKRTWFLDNDSDEYPGKSIESCGNPYNDKPNHSDPSLGLGSGASHWYKYNVTINYSSPNNNVIHKIRPGTVDCNDNDDDILNREDWYLDNDSDGYWSNKTKKCYNPGNKSLGSNSGNGPNTKSGSGWLNSTSKSDNNNHELVAGGDCNENNSLAGVSKTLSTTPSSNFIGNNSELNSVGNATYPGAKDTCDFNVSDAVTSLYNGYVVNLDNDCDGQIDQLNDTDGDTYTTCGTRTNNKSDTFDFTYGHYPTDNTTAGGVTGWECNDNEASVHRGQTEMCDTLDHDCDGDIYNFSWPDDGTVNKDLRGSPKEACTADGKAVNEYYCNEQKAEIVSNGLMSCTKGDGCYSGACRSCFSTDLSDVDSAQENTTEKGITWNNTYDIVGPGGDPKGLEDTCKDTDTLIEYSCSSSQGSNINRTSLECSNEFDESWSCVLGECVCNPDYKLIPGSCGSDGKGTYEDVNNCYNWSSTSYPKTKEGYCSKTGIVNDQDIDSLEIAGQPFDSSKDYSDSGVRSVTVNKSGNIARFDWNFSRILDLRSADIEVSDEDSDQGHLVINGLHVGKTVKIERVAETDQVCLEDSIEVEDVDDLSNDCNEDGEILIDCPGSNSGYSCNIVNNGSQYEVSTLRHSGVKEFLNETGDDEDIFDNSGDLNGDFDSGDSSQNLSKCTRRNYKCTGWSNCDGGVMTRNCQKVENCRGGVSRPETSQSCGVKGAVEQVTGKEEGFPWKFVLIVVGGLVVVLTIAIILVNMKSGSSSSKSRKSSSSSSSSSSTSSRNLTSSSGSSSSNSSSSNQFSGSSNSSSSSSNKNKGYFKRGISRKYQQRGRG